MRLRRAIEIYKEHIDKSLNGDLDFEFIRCKDSCGCIYGIKWHDMKFEHNELTVNNGFQFRVNWNLANDLESKFWPLIRKEPMLRKIGIRQDQLDNLTK